MAIFTLTETTEIAVACFAGDGATRDAMGLVLRDGPDQPWYFRWRFRYYDAAGCDPADPDAPDTKNVYEARATDGAPEHRGRLVDMARTAFALLKAGGFGDRIEIYDVNGGVDAFRAAVAGSTFMHMTASPLAAGPERPQ